MSKSDPASGSEYPVHDRIKRQQRWMLPVLAALFVLNFAAFVNGRLVTPAAALTADSDREMAANAFLERAIDIRANHNQKVHVIRTHSADADCEKDKRRVHVRSFVHDADGNSVVVELR